MVRLIKICDRVIECSFYLLLFLVPLVLTPLNYELFEYNKMMFTYALTIIIVGAWLTKMVVAKQFSIQRTPLDIPLLLFAISQLLSALFSIDRHVSLWGYYSRFHGGLLSTLAYILLYYALVSNLNKEKALSAIRYSLCAATLVAAYGVAEHFGIDAQYWVQDVKNRVFSTLGQPNWLAAYLSVLIPVAIAFGLQTSKLQATSRWNFQFSIFNFQFSNKKLFAIGYLLLAILFYLALLYTKSRSGFLGFWVGNLIFWAIILFQFRRQFLRWFLIVNCTFLIINFFVGSPFEQINKYFSFSAIREKITHVAPPPSSPPPPGGTESGEIRKIVWQGAVEIWRHYPLFGSGVETFAFSYYQYRPVEHNLVSEWDFLYNKAHNEYLNFLATTGAFGLGSYLLLIGWFIVWFIRKFTIYNLQFTIKKDKNSTLYIVNYALLAGYVSILVSNFFGFSVVVVGLFFFLIPAFSFILTDVVPDKKQFSNETMKQLSTPQWILTVSILFTIFYLLFSLSKIWLADVSFARGYNLSQVGEYQKAYEALKEAIKGSPSEPLYRDELSYAAALWAVEAAQEKDTSRAASLIEESLTESQKALEISPRNVNFWKTRTRVFYALSSLNEDYNKEALEAIKKAAELAPTDAKVSYNLAILYGRVGETEMAIKTLEKTIELKPDYSDAHYALALYLKAEGKDKEAAEHLKYILEKISSQDAQAKKTLEEWGRR